MHETVTLDSGVSITLGDSWCVTQLEGGTEVHAHPNDDSLDMAMKLGYGYDVALMTREHDPLHSLLADWIGYGESRSLRVAAGLDPDNAIAVLEEEVVLAIQRLINAIRNELPANT